MYEPSQQVSDYQAETVNGLEVTEENVLVLQNTELENSSIAGVGEDIDQGLADLEEVLEVNGLVQEAIQNLGSPSAGSTLNRAIRLRTRLSKKYGSMDGHFALESFHHGSGLEDGLVAEAAAQKGFFRRIIDAIINAFKWLWNKLVELASSNDRKNKSISSENQKVKREVQELKTKIETVAQAAVEIDNGPLQASLGCYGAKVGGSEIRQVLAHMQRNLEDIAKVYEAAFKSYENLVQKVERLQEVSDVEADTIVKSAMVAIESKMVHLPHGNNQDLQDIEHRTANPDIDKLLSGSIRKIDGFLDAGKAVYWEIKPGAASEIVLFRSSFGTSAKEIKSATVMAPLVSELDALVDANDKLGEHITALNKSYTAFPSKQAARLTERLAVSLNSFDVSESKEAHAVIAGIRKAGQSIQGLVVTTSHAQNAVLAVRAQTVEYFKKSITVNKKALAATKAVNNA